jgi:hypothetical protein
MSTDLTLLNRITVTRPALFAPDSAASKRFFEFFTANIRNPNTRKAYTHAPPMNLRLGAIKVPRANCATSSRSV